MLRINLDEDFHRLLRAKSFDLVEIFIACSFTVLMSKTAQSTIMFPQWYLTHAWPTPAPHRTPPLTTRGQSKKQLLLNFTVMEGRSKARMDAEKARERGPW